ncbi:GL25357 [Drosophila persimilis]|uniref:GL25357 n=1 Tax=Drosophila persimilis TaxID=7234 RepID=B4GU32_DROPE|nr:GL25357 [Drosophila persimilis]
MERMWRKVNHSLRNTKSQNQQQQPNAGSVSSGGGAAVAIVCGANAATPQSTDTINSAGGFGDGQLVVAVQGLPGAAATSGGAASAASAAATTATVTAKGGSNATGRRLASSGQTLPVSGGASKSLSQHVLQTRTASSERRRRRRRKSRPRRGGGMGAVTSCVGDPSGDNMSSSGGFYTLKDHHQYYRHGHHGHGAAGGGGSGSSRRLFATSAPSGTVMMYPNPQRAPTLTAAGGSGSGCGAAVGGGSVAVATVGAGAVAQPDISLRQRAVAKLRMFNFHLNWDLHMTHCKPCGPRLSGSGNIITRRLCRNRRREDNELYRSNSFKFERFERKECLQELSNTLQKQYYLMVMDVARHDAADVDNVTDDTELKKYFLEKREIVTPQKLQELLQQETPKS